MVNVCIYMYMYMHIIVSNIDSSLNVAALISYRVSRYEKAPISSCKMPYFPRSSPFKYMSEKFSSYIYLYTRRRRFYDEIKILKI